MVKENSSMKRITLFFILFAGLPILAACSVGGAAESAPSPLVITLAATDIAYDVDRIEANAGQTIQPSTRGADQASYFAELPAHALDVQDDLIERLLDFAFDVLEVRRFELRVYGNLERRGLSTRAGIPETTTLH